MSSRTAANCTPLFRFLRTGKKEKERRIDPCRLRRLKIANALLYRLLPRVRVSMEKKRRDLPRSIRLLENGGHFPGTAEKNEKKNCPPAIESSDTSLLPRRKEGTSSIASFFTVLVAARFIRTVRLASPERWEPFWKIVNAHDSPRRNVSRSKRTLVAPGDFFLFLFI